MASEAEALTQPAGRAHLDIYIYYIFMIHMYIYIAMYIYI